MENKIIGLAFLEKDGWVSCQTILSDLVSAYQNAFGEDFIYIPIYSNSSSLKLIVEKILINNPAHIVFLSYGFQWSDWIKEFLNQSKNKPHFSIHLYGSFLWQMTELVKASTFTDQCRFRFITASNALEKQGQKLFRHKSTVCKIPFPFLDQLITPESNDISLIRKELGIDPEQKVFLYAGRISRQKNIISLMKLFEKYYEENRNTKLILCGSLDDFYWPLDRGHYLNFEAENFFMHLEEFSSKNIPIEYVGPLSKEKLSKYFLASDSFISLSTFEGEDWGRAIFEARLHGLPAVLTAWGGFRDFHQDESIFLCPVFLENGNLVLEEKSFFEMMTQSLRKGRMSFDHFETSLSKISRDLKTFYDSPNFERIEFTSFFKMLVHFHVMQGNGDQEFYERYEELFSSYWK